MAGIDSESWKKELGYQSPDESKMCHCCANVGVEDQASEMGYWYYCAFAINKFSNTSDRETKLKYKVFSKGVCEFFKRRPKRCPDYNSITCKRRNCQKDEYDNNCMEIIK